MTTIHILGKGDAAMQALKNNMAMALSEYPIGGSMEEVLEDSLIEASGVTHTPAVMVDGEVLSEGNVPSVEDLKRMLRNRQLSQGKLFKLRRIIIPVDMSPASENAMVYGCKMARLFQASVEVVYSMDSIFEGSVPSPSGVLASYRNTMQEELDDFVRQVVDREKLQGSDTGEGKTDTVEQGSTISGIRTRIAFGFAEEVLIDMSKHADLIVMGTLGKSGIARKLFGSVSIAVSKNAHCPVLLVPPQAQYRGFTDILYASHFDSLDALTIKQTVAFARRFNSQLHFVQVGQAGEKGSDLEKKLFEINYVYADPDMPFLYNRIVGDDLVESLHHYAFQHRVGLFVFVTHQRAFWENLLHRSMTKEMLLHTGIPVLIIHADNYGQDAD